MAGLLYGGGLHALGLLAFLTFVVAGAIWLVVTVQHADPLVTRRNAGVVAAVSAIVLVALLVGQAIFFGPAGQRRATAGVQTPRVGPGLMRPGMPGGMQPAPRFRGPQSPTAPGTATPAPSISPRT